MTLNFSSICRLCLGQKDGLLPLFGEDDSLPARIMTFAPVIKVIRLFTDEHSYLGYHYLFKNRLREML